MPALLGSMVVPGLLCLSGQSAPTGDEAIGDEAMMAAVVRDDEAVDPKDLAFFEARIRPVLIEHCYGCHSADASRLRGDFALDTSDSIRRGGPSGPGIVPGDPDASLVIKAVRSLDGYEMPPAGQLPPDVIADLERWVRDGAVDPRGVTESVVETPSSGIDLEAGRDFWAFQRPTAPEVPDVNDDRWPRTDVDRFVLHAMETHGLQPVNDATPGDLLRRLSFALTGLPPTPEAIEDFTADRSAGATERLVDRLLDSPRFGERWGRHWLDVARYAESSGKESNVLYPHAWRYRDYVIHAFNDDKPYDLFLKEQLAGDLLPAFDAEEHAEQIVATGYLAIGSKSHNARSKAQFALDVADEQIDAISQGMLGLTISCARCHDHKFDPIPTSDYYAMVGLFLSTETCFGTTDGGGNRRSAPLVELPAEARVAPGMDMPVAFRAALEQRLERSRTQLEDLVEASKGLSRRDNPNIARIRNTRASITILEGLLERYDASGAPSGEAFVAMGARDIDAPRDARILVRGELDKAGDRVARGFPQVLTDEMTPAIDRAASGRLELADWIGSEANPLTARVWVNRVWLHLFGTPIVPTPDNFGVSGLAPTHPDLLDHLAVEFMANGWSTKALIRGLVLSRTYGLGSYHHATNHRADPENVYLWRMSRRRLEAESIRDAILAASGTLDVSPPGGSPVAFLEGSARVLDRARGLDLDPPVRSIYLPVLRDRVPDSLAVFDFAEPSFVTGDREETNVPSQALYLLNAPFVMNEALAMADRLLDMRGDDGDRVVSAFLLALGREPTAAEVKAVRVFFEDFPDAQGASADDRPRRRRGRQRGNDVGMRRLGWSTFCQSLFASAEFRYLN
jgi:hypothetical protein